MVRWWQVGFQDGVSSLMVELIEFHDYVMVVVFGVVVLVGGAMASIVESSFTTRTMLENQMVEGVWTVVPAVILIFLALPSLHLLYLSDELVKPMVTMKAIGHQWYWSYEYTDFRGLVFDSFMVGEEDLLVGDYRLLEVDSRAILPFNVEVRILVTSADVIHSWAVPSLGVKVDAVPGRLNQVGVVLRRGGVYYGQCSEICGANHSFMPIVVESLSWEDFLKWTKQKQLQKQSQKGLWHTSPKSSYATVEAYTLVNHEDCGYVKEFFRVFRKLMKDRGV